MSQFFHTRTAVKKFKDQKITVLSNKILVFFLDSIELESVHHMFRYISEVQQESKGGYFKGKINLFESECVERFYLELSLIQGVDDEANDDFTPNLLLFTHRTRKTPIKIMPPFKAFNYK